MFKVFIFVSLTNVSQNMNYDVFGLLQETVNTFKSRAFKVWWAIQLPLHYEFITKFDSERNF